MEEQYRIRRSFSGTLQIPNMQRHLNALRRQPSQDILMRSSSHENQPRSITVLKTRPSSPARSLKSRSNLAIKFDAPVAKLKLPAINRNDGRLRLLSNSKKLRTQEPIGQRSGLQPNSALKGVILELQKQESGRFLYAKFDGYLNFEIIGTTDEILTGELPKVGLGTISADGVMHCASNGSSLYLSTAEVSKYVERLIKLAKNHFFRTFLQAKVFRKWSTHSKQKQFYMSRTALTNKVDFLDPEFRRSLRVCYNWIEDCMPESIFYSGSVESAELSQYIGALDQALRRKRNMLNQSELVSLLRATLEPLRARIAQVAVENSIQQDQMLGRQFIREDNLNSSALFRFIRKILYIVSEARLSYVNKCYTQLLEKVTSGLKLYQARDKGAILEHIQAVLNDSRTAHTTLDEALVLQCQINKKLHSLQCAVALEEGELRLSITQQATLGVLINFLQGITCKMQCARELVRGLDPSTREIVRQALSSLISSQKCGLSSNQDWFISIKSDISASIREHFQEISLVVQQYQMFIDRILVYVNSSKATSEVQQLQEIKIMTTKCEEGLLDAHVGFVYLTVTNVRNQLIALLQKEAISINMKVQEEFLQIHSNLKASLSNFCKFIGKDSGSVEGFVACCLRMEDYDELKVDEIVKPQENLRRVLSIMEDINHKDKDDYLRLFTAIDNMANELDNRVSIFRSKLQESAKQYISHIQSLSEEAHHKLKTIRVTCLQNLEQAFPTLLAEFNLYIQELHVIKKNIREISVLEKLAAVDHPTQFPLAKILMYKLVHVISLLEDFLQYRQSLSRTEGLYRELNLSELSIYLEETINKIKSKFKALEHFERLLQRLLRYFQQQLTAIRTVINLQQLTYTDVDLINEESPSTKQALKQIEEILLRPKMLIQLIESNVHELYEYSAIMVRKKQAKLRMQTVIEDLQLDWQTIHFTTVQHQNIEVVQNLNEIIDMLQEYDIQLRSSRHINIEEQAKASQQMVQYSLESIQELGKEQAQMQEINSLVNNCGLSDLSFKDCLTSWEGVMGWIRNSKLGKIGRDQRGQHFSHMLRRSDAQLKITQAHIDLLSENQCLIFPKLYFFSPSEVLSLLTNQSMFFPKYYEAMEGAVDLGDELRLTTKYHQTILLSAPWDEDEQHINYYALYDEALKLNIHSSIISWLRNKEQANVLNMLNQRELGQVISCVDTIQLCLRFDSLACTLFEPSQVKQEQERIGAGLSQIIKTLRLTYKDCSQASYEYAALSTSLMARINLRERLQQATRQPESVSLAISIRQYEGKIYLETAGYRERLQYEPVKFNSTIVLYPGSQRNHYHLVSSICRTDNCLIQNTDTFEEVGVACMRQINRFPITQENLLRKVTAVTNTETWSYFTLLQNPSEVLQELAMMLQTIKATLQSNGYASTISYQGRTLRVVNKPILLLYWPAENHRKIPERIRQCYRTTCWVPPSIFQVARLTLGSRGLDQPEIVRATEKVLSLVDTYIFLKNSSVDLACNALQLTKRICDEFINKYTRGKCQHLQLFRAVKNTLSFTEKYQEEMNLIEEELAQYWMTGTSPVFGTTKSVLIENGLISKTTELIKAAEGTSTVFVIGDSWSGKTSLVESAIKKLGIAKSYRFNLFVNAKDPKTNVQLLSRLIRKCREEDPCWLVLQNFYSEQDKPYFEHLLTSNRSVDLAGGDTVRIPANTTLIWELDTMSQLPISTVLHTRKICLLPTVITLQNFFIQKADNILGRCSIRSQSLLRITYIEFLRNLQEFFAGQFYPFRVQEGVCAKQIINDTLELADALMPSAQNSEAESTFTISTTHQKLLYYSFAYVLSMCTIEDQRKAIDKYVKDVLLKKQYFSKASIFDCMLDTTNKAEGLLYVPKLEVRLYSLSEIQTVFVHTLETTVLKHLFESLISAGKNVKLFGGRGCGKSLFLRQTLSSSKKSINLIKCNRKLSCQGLYVFLKETALQSKSQEPVKPTIALIEDVSMAADARGVYHFLKTELQLRLLGRTTTLLTQVITEQIVQKNEEDSLIRELIPFKMDICTAQHFESVFRIILTTFLAEGVKLSSHCTEEILKSAKQISKSTTFAIEAINKSQVEMERPVQSLVESIYEPLELSDIKQELLSSFRYLAQHNVREQCDIIDIFMHGLTTCIKSTINCDQEASILSGITLQHFGDLLSTINPNYDSEENYYWCSSEDRQVLKVDRNRLEETFRVKLKQEFDISNFLLFNKEFMDYVYGVSLATTCQRNILVQHCQRLPRAVQVHQLIEIFGKEVVTIPPNATWERFIEIIRCILQKRTGLEQLVYLVFTSNASDKLHDTLQIIQRIYCGLPNEEEISIGGKKIMAKEFRQKIRFAFFTSSDIDFRSVLEFKDLFRSCSRIRIRKPSKTTIQNLIGFDVSMALFNQSRNLTKLSKIERDHRESVEERKRHSSLFIQQRTSQFFLLREGKHTFPEQLKDILSKAFELYYNLEQGEFMHRYFRRSERLHKFLTSFTTLIEAKQNSLMYKQRVLELSKQIIFGAADFINRYNQRRKAIQDERSKLQSELEHVQKRKNLKRYFNWQFRPSLHDDTHEEDMDNEQLSYEQRIVSMQSIIAAKREAVHQLRDLANSSFYGINRADLSEIKAEFTGNYETIRPLFESICLLLDEPPKSASLKKVVFDANFKSKLSKSMFEKCSDSVLQEISQRMQSSRHEKLVALQGLHDWIKLGVQHELVIIIDIQMKRKVRVERSVLEKKMSELSELLKKERPEGAESLNDSYQQLCEKETNLTRKLDKLQEQERLQAKEHYIEGLQKLCSIQPDWSNFHEQTNKDQQHLFYESISTSLFLAIGVSMEPNQERLLRNALVNVVNKCSMVKPSQFYVGDFLMEVCSHSRSIQLPSSPELRQKILGILFSLEQSFSIIMLACSQSQLKLFLNYEACVYLSARSTNFEQELLRCLIDGRCTFITGNITEEHQLLTLIRHQCVTGVSILRWKGKNISIKDSFRLLFVVDNIGEADRYPEATAMEFRPSDQDIAQCIASKLFVELLDFNIEQARLDLIKLESTIEKRLWDLLNQLSESQISKSQPLSQEQMKQCLTIHNELDTLRREAAAIRNSINKVQVYDREIFVLADKLAPIFKAYNRSVAESWRQIPLDQFVIAIVNSVDSLLESVPSVSQRRQSLRKAGNLQEIAAKIRQHCLSQLNVKEQVVLAVTFYCLDILNQHRISHDDLSRCLTTIATFYQIRFPLYTSFLEMGFQVSQTQELRRAQFRSCLASLFHRSATDQADVVTEIRRYKLSFGQSCSLKRVLAPRAFRKQLLSNSSKFIRKNLLNSQVTSSLSESDSRCSDEDIVETGNRLGLEYIIEGVRRALDIRLSLRISFAQMKEKLYAASTNPCLKESNTVEDSPAKLYIRQMHSKCIAQYNELSAELSQYLSAISRQQSPSVATLELLTNYPLVDSYSRLKSVYRKCQYYKHAASQPSSPISMIDLEEELNPAMHLTLIANGRTLLACKEGSIRLKRGTVVLPCNPTTKDAVDPKLFTEVVVGSSSHPIVIYAGKQDKELLELAYSFDES